MWQKYTYWVPNASTSAGSLTCDSEGGGSFVVKSQVSQVALRPRVTGTEPR
jgi:hypothetical protein